MIANLVIGGLAAGCLYAMVGIAIVIVLNTTDIANFAQGEMAIITTFFAYWLLEDIGLAWWQAVAIAAVFGLVQGIIVQQVQLQKVDPPAQVIDSLRDVQAARIDQERAHNEAQTYANRVVPEARGHRRPDCRGAGRREWPRRKSGARGSA